MNLPQFDGHFEKGYTNLKGVSNEKEEDPWHTKTACSLLRLWFYLGHSCHLLALPSPPLPLLEPLRSPVKGICVYYNDKFQGHVTASGEKYDKGALTAAHRTLPFDTMVKVTNLENHKSVVVRVNDRGPQGGSTAKIIEITSRAAKEIDMIKKGKVQCQMEVVESDGEERGQIFILDKDS